MGTTEISGIRIPGNSLECTIYLLIDTYNESVNLKLFYAIVNINMK